MVQKSKIKFEIQIDKINDSSPEMIWPQCGRLLWFRISSRFSCRNSQAAMEADGEVGILNKFFFVEKDRTAAIFQQTENKKNPVNPQFILQSGHGHLEAVNDRGKVCSFWAEKISNPMMIFSSVCLKFYFLFFWKWHG